MLAGREGSLALKIRFSAAGYSFASKKLLLTEPVTRPAVSYHLAFLTLIVYPTGWEDYWSILTIRDSGGHAK